MRKKFSELACVLAAAIVVTGIAACKKDAEISPTDFVGETVTEEEWNAAFQAENFENVKLIGARSAERENARTESEGVTIIDGNYGYIRQTFFAGDTKEYYCVKNVNVYGKNDEGKWVPWYGITSAFEIADSVRALNGKYGNYEYSAERKGYIVKDSSASSPYQFIYKFFRKKLSAALYYEKDELVTSLSVVYGGQKVKLPNGIVE